MMDRSDVCVLLPTLDEAGTIGGVVDGFHGQGFENVLVVDGRSTDETQAVAREHGARVVVQRRAGKGQAVRQAVRRVDAPVVLMADGDGTYRPEDADAMLEPIFEGRAEHVIGDRFADMDDGAMTRFNATGNRLINGAFRVVHGRDLQDILSGYRAFTRESFERYNLNADGFGIETELAVECVKHGTPTAVVPVTYRTRPDESETNLHPVKDGGRILLTLYRLAKTNNPLFYFGSVGVAAVFAGVALAAWVGYEWFVLGVSHEAVAVVSAAGVLLGVQLLMFGVLSDIIVAVNREQTRRLEELAEQLSQVEAETDAERDERESEPVAPGVDADVEDD